MIKNLVFDLGHVLIDIEPKRSLRAFAALVRPQTDTQLITADGLLGGHSSQLIDAYQVGQITTEQFIATIRQYCREGVTDQQIMDAWMAMLLPFQERKRQLLKSLHEQHIPFFILSNINDSHVEWTRQNCPELQWAGGLFFSNEMHLAKPDPRAYKNLIENSGILPQETLYIDDLNANIEAGKALNFQCLTATDDEAWIPVVEQLLK